MKRITVEKVKVSRAAEVLSAWMEIRVRVKRISKNTGSSYEIVSLGPVAIREMAIAKVKDSLQCDESDAFTAEIIEAHIDLL